MDASAERAGLEVTLRQLAALFVQYRFDIGAETDFQDGLSIVLTQNGFHFLREHDLGGKFGRIDFFLPNLSVGIELKVKGSPTDVLRQLHRYALSADIKGLMLVTGRARLAFAPV